MTKEKLPYKALLVPDNHDAWSSHNRCNNIAKFCHGEFKIYKGCANDFERFADSLASQGWLIHFNYLGGVTHNYNLFCRYPKRTIITLNNERSLKHGHGVDHGKLMEMLGGCLEKVSLSKALHKEYGGVFIPNGIDLEMFCKPRAVTVGYAGTEKDNKNYPLLEEVCRKRGVRLHALTYDKKVPYEQMPEEYRKMDLLIHPSLTEGSNNVVLEALAMGVPVYMTKVGTWEELKGYVHFIEPTEEGINSALDKYFARSFIDNMCSWEKVAGMYDDLYMRCYVPS